MAFLQIQTARLILRPLTANDTEALTQTVYGDSSVTRFLPPSDAPASERSAQTIARYRAYWHSAGYGPWAIITRQNGTFIGRGGLKPFPEYDLPELIYALTPSAWGMGYATELSQACVRLAFEVLETPAVIAFTDPSNTRSRRVLERIGMRYFGIQDTQYYAEPHTYYRLDREHWQPSFELSFALTRLEDSV